MFLCIILDTWYIQLSPGEPLDLSLLHIAILNVLKRLIPLNKLLGQGAPEILGILDTSCIELIKAAAIQKGFGVLLMLNWFYRWKVLVLVNSFYKRTWLMIHTSLRCWHGQYYSKFLWLPCDSLLLMGVHGFGSWMLIDEAYKILWGHESTFLLA